MATQTPTTPAADMAPPAADLDVADFDLDALAALFTDGAGAVLTRALLGEETGAAHSPRLARPQSTGPVRCDLTGEPFTARAHVLTGLAYSVGDAEHHDTLDVHPLLVASGRAGVEAGLRARLGGHLEELYALLVEVRWDVDLARAVHDGGLER